MVAVDTNSVVRLLTGDDPEQIQRSKGVFEREQVFIPATVILETEWVLRYAYEFPPAEIASTLRKLAGPDNVSLGDETAVALALDWYEEGLDFAGARHLSQEQHCARMFTFDKAFVKRSQSLPSCPVEFPLTIN
jgi:predicted nucleic-acid-binding protein